MIDDWLKPQLDKLHISLDDFSALLIRLLDYGVISRLESQIEAQFYDRYLVCADWVESYLSLLNMRLLHDRHFQYVRVFPPGAEVPGLPDDDNSSLNQGLRYKPNQQEVALILVLRVEYEKALREGALDDDGAVLVSFETIAFSLKNLLKRALPEQAQERRALFKRLRQWRLVRFNADDELNLEEAWLSIQPSITSFVTDEVLRALNDDATDQSEDDTPQTQDPEQTDDSQQIMV
jgi:hypothetical protein